VVDLDGDPERPQALREVIDEELQERVCVIGVFTEPEDLKSGLRESYEAIGERLAEACVGGQIEEGLWTHELLEHNRQEVDRVRAWASGSVALSRKK
jgi:hypothetical protein